MIARRWLVLFVTLLGAIRVGAEAPRVIMFDSHEGKEGPSALQRAFEAAGCPVRLVGDRRLPRLDEVDIVVLSERVPRDSDFQIEIFARAQEFAAFLERGGIVLDCAARAPAGYQPRYLPFENRLEFVREDFSELVMFHPGEPLSSQLAGALKRLGPELGPDAAQATSYRPVRAAVTRQRGFRVLAAGDMLGMYAFVVETAIGRGRAYISTLPTEPEGVPGDANATANPDETATALANGLLAIHTSQSASSLSAFASDPGADLRTPFSWRIILLPDTQCYIDDNKAVHNEKHFHRQIRWILDNYSRTDIRYVLHLGDITQHNAPTEWVRARNIISGLNGHVPYLLVPGNHDIGPGGNAYNRESLMAGYFPEAETKKNSGFGGAFKAGDPANTYHLFTAGGVDWLLVGLEFGPRDEVMRWARSLVEKYPRRRLILVTHAYLYDDDTRFDFKAKGTAQAGNPQYYHIMAEAGYANDGEQMWQAFVRKTRNPGLVVSGHVLGDGLGLLVSRNDAGRSIVQMLVNFQHGREGGEAYLRILEFNRDSSMVRVMDYSPSLDRYRPGAQSLFTVKLQ